MSSAAQRLTAVAMAIALSGSPAVLSACMGLCLSSPAVPLDTDGPQADHAGHGATMPPAAASAHDHHGAALADPVVIAVASPVAPSHERLGAGCERCCNAGPSTLAVGLSAKRTDGLALTTMPVVSVAPLHGCATKSTGASLSRAVPPPAPTGAPLPLRI